MRGDVSQSNWMRRRQIGLEEAYNQMNDEGILRHSSKLDPHQKSPKTIDWPSTDGHVFLGARYELDLDLPMQEKTRATRELAYFESESSIGQAERSPTPVARLRHYAPREDKGSLQSFPSNEARGDVIKNNLVRSKRDQLRKERMLANQRPIFARDHSQNLGQRKSKRRHQVLLDDEPEPPPNIPRAWTSRVANPGAKIRNILSPECSNDIKNEVASISAEYIQSCRKDAPLRSKMTSLKPVYKIPQTTFPNLNGPISKEEWKVNSPWDADDDFTAGSHLISSPTLKFSKTKRSNAQKSRIPSFISISKNPSSSEEFPDSKLSPKSIKGSSRSSPEQTSLSCGNLHPVMGDNNFESDGVKHEASSTLTSWRGKHQQTSNPDSRLAEKMALAEFSVGDNDRNTERNGVRLSEKARSKDVSPVDVEAFSKDQSENPKVSSVGSSVLIKPNQDCHIISEIKPNREDNFELKISEQAITSTSTDSSPEDYPISKNSQFKFLPTENSEINPEYKALCRSSSLSKLDKIPDECAVDEIESRKQFGTDNRSDQSSIQPYPSRLDKNFAEYEETPRPKADVLALPTPKVLGAYIQTPLLSAEPDGLLQTRITRRRAISLEGQNFKFEGQNSSQIMQLQTRYTTQTSCLMPTDRSTLARPRLINTSRRITVSDDLRRIKMEENIEDSGLDFMFEGDRQTDRLINSDSQVAMDSLEFNRNRVLPIFPASEEKFESIIIERMNQRLKNASYSIHDARQGIERLERQVSTSPKPWAHIDKPDLIKGSSIATKITRLFIIKHRMETEENSGIFRDRGWRFTWIGLVFCTLWLWYIVETAMCEAFCHPRYSNQNTWQPSDPFFPWALPTKLDQWTGGIVSRSAEDILDWYDPGRHQRWRRPQQAYSGHDWWLGGYGPAPTMIRTFGQSETDNMNDDEEIWN